MATPLRIASVNVNGIRAAYRNGMGAWLDSRGVDILAIQEVRAETEHVTELLGDEWSVLHDAATAKGRAGVALASRGAATIHRVELGAPDFDSAGRWLEADFEVGGRIVTVVSAYVHSGEADTPKQVEKYKFLDAMQARLPELAAHNELAVVMGDLNVGHRTLDIRNWKGNVKRAGFLPEERAYFDRFIGAEDDPAYNAGAGLGWVDIGRRAAPARSTARTPGGRLAARPSTTTPAGASTTSSQRPPSRQPSPTYTVDRAASYSERWSDHAPVVVDYAI